MPDLAAAAASACIAAFALVGVVGLLHLAYALLRTALGFMGAL